MSRMNHRRRRGKLPVPESMFGIGPFKRGMLHAQLRAQQQHEHHTDWFGRLDDRDWEGGPEVKGGRP